jgi:hypothetical protein
MAYTEAICSEGSHWLTLVFSAAMSFALFRCAAHEPSKQEWAPRYRIGLSCGTGCRLIFFFFFFFYLFFLLVLGLYFFFFKVVLASISFSELTKQRTEARNSLSLQLHSRTK